MGFNLNGIQLLLIRADHVSSLDKIIDTQSSSSGL